MSAKNGKMIPCFTCGKENYYCGRRIEQQSNFFCSLKCKGRYKTKQLFRRIPRVLIYHLYVTESRAYRYCCKALEINERSMKILLNGYAIPIRHGSDAVATQWIDNGTRRKSQAIQFVENIANSVRETMTPAEERFTAMLAHLGVEFEFQYPVYGYLLDFGLLPIKLGIEIDGKEHRRLKKTREQDQIRTKELTNLGWLILRFSNFEVLNQPIKVQDQIGAIINRLQQ